MRDTHQPEASAGRSTDRSSALTLRISVGSQPLHCGARSRPAHRPVILLATLLTLFAAGGSSCPWARQPELLPYTLPETATLDQLISAVNENSARVQSVNISQATIALPGLPALPVSIALEPPLRFRLRASTAFTGTEVDLGSNDDLFWLWIKHNQPPAMYYCRHDQFATSAARQIMPVEPQWLVEALGLVRIDPIDLPQGPTPVGAGRSQIRTIRHSVIGDLTKITVVDPRRGIVLEQNLYDAGGHLLAAARTSAHRTDPLTNAILPRHIEIDYPSAQLSMKIDIADLQVNTLSPQQAQLWAKPDYSGYPNINLADPNLFAQPTGPAPRTSQAPPPNLNYGPPSTPSAFYAPSTAAGPAPPATPPANPIAPADNANLSPPSAMPAAPASFRRYSAYP